MPEYSLLSPLYAMLTLTFVVWAYMYVKRLGYMAKHKISPQALFSPEQVNDLFPDEVNRASNNLKNLFEMPILFYLVCLLSLNLEITEPTLFYLAWGYVGLRAGHSLVHCTFNRVSLRFGFYFLSNLLLITAFIKIIISSS